MKMNIDLTLNSTGASGCEGAQLTTAPEKPMQGQVQYFVDYTNVHRAKFPAYGRHMAMPSHRPGQW